MNQSPVEEKRMVRRFVVELPVKVISNAGEQMEEWATTRDISSQGVCFYCDTAIKCNSAIEFTLTLPPEVTMTEPLRLHCRGTVVRVEGGGEKGSNFKIAAAIENYDFLCNDNLLKSMSPADPQAAV